MVKAKSTRLRFSTNDDLEILRVVVSEDPFEDPSRWRVIFGNVVQATGKEFSQRAIKEHVEYLLKLFIKEDRANLKKSGTEEQYQEKERLLQEIHDLKKESVKKSGVSSHTNNSSKEKGIHIRDAAINAIAEENQLDAAANDNSEQVSYLLQNDGTLLNNNIVAEEETITNTSNNFQETYNKNYNTPSTSSGNITTSCVLSATKYRKKRHYESVKVDALEFIKKRNESENEFRQQQLKLEEKKLLLEERKILLEEKKIALEEEKFKAETEEKSKRLEIDTQERLSHIKNMEQQQQIQTFLMSQLKEKKIKYTFVMCLFQ